jgi:hypothetical protein
MLRVCRQELKMARCPNPPKVKFNVKILNYSSTIKIYFKKPKTFEKCPSLRTLKKVYVRVNK